MEGLQRGSCMWTWWRVINQWPEMEGGHVWAVFSWHHDMLQDRQCQEQGAMQGSAMRD